MEDVNELRKILFDAIRDVKDGKLDPAKAKVIQELGQTLVNSAKVETDYLKVTGRKGGTGFIPGLVLEGPKPATNGHAVGYEGKINPGRR